MRTKNMILNTFFSLVEELVAIICAFILPKLILSFYGSQYNGLITSITQFLSCAVILRSGIGGATRAVLYKPLAEKKQDEINSIVKATDIFMKKVGCILLIIILFFSAVYPVFLKNEFEWFFTFSLFLIIGISTFAESFFGITYLIILQADQKLWISAIIKSLSYILNVIVASFLIVKNYDIHTVKLGSAIAFSIYPIILNIYVTKRYKINKKVKPNNAAISQRWDAFWHQLAVFVNNNTDVMILTVFSNMYEVSVYSIYSLILNGLKRVIVSVTNGIEGTFGDMIAKNEKKLLNENLSIVEMMIHSISTIIYSSSIVLILQFIKIYTDGITDTNYFRPFFAYILLIAQFLYATRLPYQFIIQAAGHFKQTKKYAIHEVIINIAISVFLVLKFGLVGIAIGTLLASIYKTIVYIIYMSKNIIERKINLATKKFIISIIEMILIIAIMNIINLKQEINYLNWILNAIITVAIASTIVIIGIYIFYRKEFMQFINKFKFIKKRNKGAINMGITKKEYKSFIKKEIGVGIKKIIRIFTNNSYKAIYLIRKSEYCAGKNIFKRLLSKYYSYKLGKIYGIFINPKCIIGEGLKLPHPNGIIIGETVSIGKNCTIYQQVTLGSVHRGDVKKGLQPKVGDNVTLFAGCKVIGDISLADNTTVGANAVLNKSTEKNSVYAGIPAKKIEHNKKG